MARAGPRTRPGRVRGTWKEHGAGILARAPDPRNGALAVSFSHLPAVRCRIRSRVPPDPPAAAPRTGALRAARFMASLAGDPRRRQCGERGLPDAVRGARPLLPPL